MVQLLIHSTTFLRNVWRTLDQNMRVKLERNTKIGNRRSTLKKGEGKFWGEEANLGKDHILKKKN